MTVGREIEVAVGTEGGEHLVTGGVDGFSEVFQTAHLVANELATPDVEASQTTGHIAGEIQPLPVRRDGGMGET